MTTTEVSAPARRPTLTRKAATWAALKGMLLHDLIVLGKNLRLFVAATIMQPLMLVFVLTYMFPRLGQGVGGDFGAATRFATLVLGGLVAQSVLFQAIFWVGLPMVREFGLTDELEDRVLSPVPLSTVPAAKILFGTIQGLLTVVVVLPVAAFVPDTPVLLQIHWAVLLTLVPLGCVTAAAFGFMIGTLVAPRSVPVVNVIMLPIGFLGAIFYTWDSLSAIPWIKYLVLLNPLVYLSEGFRAAMVTGVPHLPLVAAYAAIIGFGAAFTALGVFGFRRRVLS